MCNHGKVNQVRVCISDSHSHDGKEYIKNAEIDSCISDIVDALENAGIKMFGSCCSHSKRFGILRRRRKGDIMLQDGREIIIQEKQK